MSKTDGPSKTNKPAGFQKTLADFRHHLSDESKDVRNAVICQIIEDEKQAAVIIAENNVSIKTAELYKVTLELASIQNQIDVAKLEIEARFSIEMAKLQAAIMRLEQQIKMTLELETQSLEVKKALLETQRLHLLEVVADFKLTIKAPSSGLSCVCECEH